MKKMIFVGLCMVLSCTSSQAATMYISDNIKITLRTGPGTDHKILAMIKPGVPVEMVEAGEDWSRVRLLNGTEGWILNRFITPTRPSRFELAILAKKHEALQTAFSALRDQSKGYKAENSQLSSKLLKAEEMLSNLSKSYETLKRESADFLKLQADYKETASRLAEQNKKVEKLEEELDKLSHQHNIKWFLSGAGVLLLGCLIGFSVKRQRRRSSLL